MLSDIKSPSLPSLLIVLGVCVHAQGATGKESPIDVMAALRHMKDNFKGRWSFSSYWKESEVVLWRNVFGMKVHLDFLVQPATVPNLCILCVYGCKVRVVLQRATAVYIFKWGEIRILCERKFPSLSLYVYLRSMPTRLGKAESVEDSLLYQTLTNCWGGSCTMLDCKFLRYVVSMINAIAFLVGLK